MIRLKVRLFSTIKDRFFGLSGKDKPEPALFLTRFGIHTFGLRFPLDIVILDGKDKVVKLEKSLKPNSLFFWPIRYNKVLELPAGAIGKHRVKIGSKTHLKMVK
jgi:uncharacterized membrane protein (UPF0127 family)